MRLIWAAYMLLCALGSMVCSIITSWFVVNIAAVWNCSLFCESHILYSALIEFTIVSPKIIITKTIESGYYDNNDILGGGLYQYHKNIWIDTMEDYLKDKEKSELETAFQELTDIFEHLHFIQKN